MVPLGLSALVASVLCICRLWGDDMRFATNAQLKARDLWRRRWAEPSYRAWAVDNLRIKRARRRIVAALLLFASSANAGDLALGDSLAVGTGQALGWRTVAKVGASSCAILRMVPEGVFDRVVISAGTNDPPGRCVEAIRERINARLVIWILPVNAARGHVAAVAMGHGDRIVRYAPSRRGWPHPASYAPLARAVRDE